MGPRSRKNTAGFETLIKINLFLKQISVNVAKCKFKIAMAIWQESLKYLEHELFREILKLHILSISVYFSQIVLCKC